MGKGHPGRRFPGRFMHGWFIRTPPHTRRRSVPAREELKVAPAHSTNSMSLETLWERLNHYKHVVTEHDIPLPFSDQPR